jgi:starch-binding outer membrane protein, SusD/RagB family
MFKNIIKKNRSKLVLGIGSLSLLMSFTSCSDFFDSDSKSVVKTDGQVYTSEQEARSGMFGLLQGLQTVGDNYVLMGELRGDLMTTTSNSSQELHDISEFDAKGDNSYLKERQWYALVNNCNYYINHLDTAVTQLEKGVSVKFMRPYMAQAKAIRAWSYLNLCLDYGSVRYTTQPILESQDAKDKAQVQDLKLEQLLPLLITDVEQAEELLPAKQGAADTWVAGYSDPGFTASTTYGSYMARQLMFPLRFILGELYMWNEDFEKAAQAYYDLIYMDRLALCSYRNLYNSTGTAVSTRNWASQFSGFNYADILTAIVFSSDYKDNASQLYSMANSQYVIAPSQALIDNFNAQFYYTNRAIAGDLRGLYGTYSLRSNTTTGVDDAYITKYGSMTASSNRYVSPCRASLIWLRYAEAVNRLGKPKLAFYGFLKYGLSAYIINLYRDKDALRGEITGEPWMDFGQDAPDGATAELFKNNNRGFHARGCGNTDMNETYQIEEQSSLQDSILWVEDQLVNEYALETALEGNRFHDLMRISHYRHDASYLANKVAAKFSGSMRDKIIGKLSDQSNWYLPEESK